jgi:hypothetical protein
MIRPPKLQELRSWGWWGWWRPRHSRPGALWPRRRRSAPWLRSPPQRRSGSGAEGGCRPDAEFWGSSDEWGASWLAMSSFDQCGSIKERLVRPSPRANCVRPVIRRHRTIPAVGPDADAARMPRSIGSVRASGHTQTLRRGSYDSMKWSESPATVVGQPTWGSERSRVDPSCLRHIGQLDKDGESARRRRR